MATDGIDDLAPGDAAILDALYRDGDDAGLDQGQRATLAEWQAVRGVVRHAREQGFDVEPPAAGTRGSFELLMTAARTHATPVRPGLWARLRAGLMTLLAHPAMAGAAALVVVGGAAGVLYLKGQHRVVRPPAAERRPAEPARLPSPITDGELGDVLDDRQPGDRPGPAARPDVGGAGSAAPTEPGPGPGAAAAIRTATEGGGRPERVGGTTRVGERPVPKTTPRPPSGEEVDQPAASEAPLEEAPAGTGGGEAQDVGRTGGLAPATVTNTPRPSPPMASPPMAAPPPAAPPAPKTPKPVAPAQIAVDEAPVAPGGASRTQAVKLTAQARVAAKAGDCATVATRSKQVAALDPAYHRDVFVRDPDIARCR